MIIAFETPLPNKFTRPDSIPTMGPRSLWSYLARDRVDEHRIYLRIRTRSRSDSRSNWPQPWHVRPIVRLFVPSLEDFSCPCYPIHRFPRSTSKTRCKIFLERSFALGSVSREFAARKKRKARNTSLRSSPIDISSLLARSPLDLVKEDYGPLTACHTHPKTDRISRCGPMAANLLPANLTPSLHTHHFWDDGEVAVVVNH